MPGTYLTELADVLRAAGLTVIEQSGWTTRGRSSGGFAPGRPTHIMVHHTASPPSNDGHRDVNYICYGSPDRPITNLYLQRSGVWWVCAAGATNTNGKGTDTWGGGVPADRMNEHALAIEVANTGTGEPYPDDQQQSLLVGTRALADHFAIIAHKVRGHFEWAPTRKIDPSGPSRWAPSGGKWDMGQFRADVADSQPDQPTGDDDVQAVTPLPLFDGWVDANVPTLVPCPASGTVFVNVTIDQPVKPGYVYAGADPNVSVVNAQVGHANSCCVPVGSLGGFYLTSTSRCRLVVSLFGTGG